LKLKLFCAVAVSLGAWSGVRAADGETTARHTFAIGTNDFLLDGQRFQIRCGEVHAPRVPREYWPHRLRMAHAMGLNTVCCYLFWNLQEPRPGEFVWSGQADAAEFCRDAQKEGLWVILRPGPYACAEWEMGGLPWWLLREDGIKLRTLDPRFMAAVRNYFKEVGRVLGPLQITRGGPILMAQVENEYGFYGKDAQYMGELRKMLIDSGFDVTLFACNPPYALRNGYRPDLFPVVNFGSDPSGGFKALRGILPQGPLMCGEFYPGWFDTWGAPHHKGKMETYLADLTTMLERGASFSIYMAHGGTTFGLWSGADRPFKPDTSSYDYDAPISEAGWPTEKFYQTRELLTQHALPRETIPEPPPRNPVLSFAPVEAKETASVFDNLPAGVEEPEPRSMEEHDQGYGWIVYRMMLAAGSARTLEAGEVHDFGFVYLDGERVGVMDRRNRSFRARLPQRSRPARLDILVEPMGRVNFGQEVHDRKGLFGPIRVVSADGMEKELSGWQVYSLPLDATMLAGLKYASAEAMRPAKGGTPNAPGFWRAFFELTKPADTFLDVRTWGKGVVWVNDHCLGRFWDIGPTQTMYVPEPWLKAGRNEVVVLDVLGPEKPVVGGLEEPILDQLHPEKDFLQSNRPEVKLDLNSVKPIVLGEFQPGPEKQELKFPAPAKGRYFCLESLSAHDGKPYAAIAELNLLDESGQALSHEGWTIAYVDSEEREREDGTAENAIDGQVANFWHTQWGSASPGHPHRLILDLGKSRAIAGIEYLPRQGNAVTGRIKGYGIYIGDDLVRR
jgi:beta-galactosidase